MKAKIFYPLIAVVFGFTLGIYFHFSMPEGTREIASKGAPVVTHDLKVSSALKECLSDRVKDNTVTLSKVGVSGKSFSTISIDCVGDKAKNLYDALAPYSDERKEQYVRYEDGSRGVARFFGNRFPPSQCSRVIRSSKGSEQNKYSCSLMLDLDYDLIKSLKI